MNRIPPNLLYLTIYNPSLRPIGPVPDDDEDAEEQAHILFYTSKERAVSRDRMLRQVGLAKALVNFSEMFNANDSCNSVHSQSRRMIMVSPEPDFWIHAGIEVAKVPRIVQDKGKSKSRDKGKKKAKVPEKGKGKETETEMGPVYDFIEGSVHDIALRQDILRGYERFKLTHGSFTSILSTLGQQALELQLERFFTVWAWTWNLEDGQDFKEHLGIPLHPRFRSLVPNLDAYSLDLPNAIILSPPHTIPSSAYSAAQYPPSLARHLLSLVPRNHPSMSNTPPDTSEGTIKAKHLPESDTPGDKDPPTAQGPSPSNFLGIPPVNMNVDMDIRKWNWPGYLTFGRGTSKRPGLEDNREPSIAGEPESGDPRTTVVEVDTNALKDAISSDNTSITSSSTSNDGPIVHTETDGIFESKDDPVTADKSNETEELPINSEQLQIPIDADSVPFTSSTPPLGVGPSQTPSLHFASTTVYLSDPENPLLTLQQKVYYALHAHMMLALIGVDGGTDPKNPDEHLVLQSAGTNAMKLFEEIEDNDVSQSTDTLPSATKILQPTDSHIASSAHFTVSSPAFASKSSHLYNAREMQAIDPEISEVFSRGQNPQHWHIARRGLGYNEDGTTINGEVFLEVFRKEASLTDVDNVLAGVVRKCGLVE